MIVEFSQVQRDASGGRAVKLAKVFTKSGTVTSVGFSINLGSFQDGRPLGSLVGSGARCFSLVSALTPGRHAVCPTTTLLDLVNIGYFGVYPYSDRTIPFCDTTS